MQQEKTDLALAELYKSRATIVSKILELNTSYTLYKEVKERCEKQLADIDKMIEAHLKMTQSIYN